jgi:hypothetical protein
MDSERAATYLRLLAEAELRRATTMAARGSPSRWHSARLALPRRHCPPLSAPTSWIRSRPTSALASLYGTGCVPLAPRTASG